MSELVYENKKWSIYKDTNMVFIKQVGPWGHSSYAFWPRYNESPKPHDYLETNSWSTNYPLDKIPMYIIAKARKYLEIPR